MGGSHIFVEKGGIFWEGRKDYGSHIVVERGGGILGGLHIITKKGGGIFWEGGVDSGRIAYSN